MKGNWLKRMGCTVLAGSAGLVMLSSAAALPTGAETAKLLGDVNGDGQITTSDVVALLQYVATLTNGEGLDLALADVDGNGLVDTSDAVMALQIAADLRQPTSCVALDTSSAVELQQMSAVSSGLLTDTTAVAELASDCAGDTSALATFDAAFFENHFLVVVGSNEIAARSLTPQSLLWDGAQYRVTVSYTEVADYRQKPYSGAVLLIPVDKYEAATVAVTYQMVTKAAGENFANSFLWVSPDETPDFGGVKENLYTVRNSWELTNLVMPLCRTDVRTAAFSRLVAAHDDAFFADHAMLVLTCNYTDHYALAGFRENEDGTRTLLISNDGIPSDPSRPNAIAPRPCIFTVDVPLSFLEGHPVTGYEVVS